MGGVCARLRPRHQRVGAQATCEWGISQPLHIRRLRRPHAIPIHRAVPGRLEGGGADCSTTGAGGCTPTTASTTRPFRPAPHDGRSAHRSAAWACRRRWSSARLEHRPPGARHRGRTWPRRLRFALYCAYNPLYRREALKRQGMRLGAPLTDRCRPFDIRRCGVRRRMNPGHPRPRRLPWPMPGDRGRRAVCRASRTTFLGRDRSWATPCEVLDRPPAGWTRALLPWVTCRAERLGLRQRARVRRSATSARSAWHAPTFAGRWLDPSRRAAHPCSGAHRALIGTSASSPAIAHTARRRARRRPPAGGMAGMSVRLCRHDDLRHPPAPMARIAAGARPRRCSRLYAARRSPRSLSLPAINTVRRRQLFPAYASSRTSRIGKRDSAAWTPQDVIVARRNWRPSQA